MRKKNCKEKLKNCKKREKGRKEKYDELGISRR
jgi:hypothetical protein